MDCQTKLVILLTLLLSLFLQTKASTPTPPASELLVKQICNKTTNTNFCMKTLKSDPRTSSAAIVQTLAEISLDLAAKDSTNTRDHIYRLFQSNSTKPNFKPALKQCVDSYDHIARGCFGSAYGEVKDKEYESANYDTMVAGDDIVACKKFMDEAKVHIKSISYRFQFTWYFISIGDVVTTMLWDSHPDPPPASN